MLILALDSLEDLDSVMTSKPDAVCIGLDPLCSRSRAIVDLERLPAVIESFHDQKIKVFINAQAMVEQKLYPQIQETFYAALDAGADGFYIADDGYITMADEYEAQSGRSVRNLLIMQPETLLCSGEDAAFYLDQGLQAASLAHELTCDEIVKSARISQKPDQIEVLIAGYYMWMESRRPLLENYLRYIGKPDQFEPHEIYRIQEQLRPAKLPIWQDEKGTHVLADTPIQAGVDILAMKEAGMERFRIDSFLMGNDWGALQVKLYRDLLEHPDKAVSFAIPSTLFAAPSLIRKEKDNGRH